MICVRKNADIFEVLDPYECSFLEKPPSQQACHLKPCGAKWFSTEWSMVSHCHPEMAPGRVPGPSPRRDARSPVASTLGSHNEGTLFSRGSPKLADLGFYRDVFIMHVILELWGVSSGLARKDQFWTPPG